MPNRPWKRDAAGIVVSAIAQLILDFTPNRVDPARQRLDLLNFTPPYRVDPARQSAKMGAALPHPLSAAFCDTCAAVRCFDQGGGGRQCKLEVWPRADIAVRKSKRRRGCTASCLPRPYLAFQPHPAVATPIKHNHDSVFAWPALVGTLRVVLRTRSERGLARVSHMGCT